MADPSCRRLFALLSDYLDGVLPARDCRQLERHLKDCRPCVAYLESLRTTAEACRKLQIGQIPPPSSEVRAALVAALGKHSFPRSGKGGGGS